MNTAMGKNIYFLSIKKKKKKKRGTLEEYIKKQKYLHET